MSNRTPEEPSAPTVLREQREANQSLVLAAIRAHEEADDARSARRVAEEESNKLRTAEAELRETAEFRERLIGIIGHDLRTPLSAMSTAASVLMLRGNLNEDDAKLAGRIIDSGERVARMISQLVEFTRARLGGGFELRLVAADLEEICFQVAEELRLTSGTAVRLEVSGDVTGHWDVDRLAAVISNLAGNAVEYATPGTPVLLQLEGDSKFVTLHVVNRGDPIPPESIDSLFEPFRRAATSGDRAKGHLGLGLYIASEIVASHGGTLEVQSADGTTTFSVRLPRWPAFLGSHSSNP